eukprot:CAMPEP_0169247868 /NCGR_PEP_ID=MMETSP1016-20121227/35527_1 /TAXON_ID=342587 /ORGANISM="Karlodinium micrum, Strain CCMP2283" /LENGTH=116 /DNA_ID=CAMNT_0009328603 /DNA_START=266 /DNA_END=612 /DNA_ORIENTATION=+
MSALDGCLPIGFSMLSNCGIGHRNLESSSLLVCSRGLRGFAYACILAFTTLVVTVSWSLVIDWSTADGLGVLTLILLAEIMFIGFVTSAALRISVAQGWLESDAIEKDSTEVTIGG